MDLAALLDKALASAAAKQARNVYTSFGYAHPNDYLSSMVQTNQRCGQLFFICSHACSCKFKCLTRCKVYAAKAPFLVIKGI